MRHEFFIPGETCVCQESEKGPDLPPCPIEDGSAPPVDLREGLIPGKNTI